jgi:hypothetical protein
MRDKMVFRLFALFLFLQSILPASFAQESSSKDLNKINIKQIGNIEQYRVDPHPDYEIKGKITWIPLIFTSEGLSFDGITVKELNEQATRISVSLDEEVTGDIVLMARYKSVDGTLVLYEPKLIKSVGTIKLKGINIDIPYYEPQYNPCHVGEEKAVEVEGINLNNLRIPVYIKDTDDFQMISSDTNIFEVTERQTIRAKKTGIATLTVRYNNFEVSKTITVVPAETPNPDWDRDGKIDANDLFRFANYWMTDETDYDLGSGLINQDKR